MNSQNCTAVLTTTFNEMDLDGDGCLSGHEIKALITKHYDEMGPLIGFDALRNKVNLMNNELLMYIDGCWRISLGGFLEYFLGVKTTTNYSP